MTTETCSISQATLLMNEIKKTGGKVFTNYFSNFPEDDEADLLTTDGAIVFIKKDWKMSRVFFCSNNPGKLAELLATCPEGSAIDYIVKGDNDLSDVFHTGGFAHYSTYTKKGMHFDDINELHLNSRIYERCYNENCAITATEADIPQLLDLMEAVFDAKTDHFPSEGEWRHIINNNRVYLYKDGGTIKSFNAFEVKGKRYYFHINYSSATPDVLYSLDKKALLDAKRDHKINYAFAWFDTKNKNAIKRLNLNDEGIYDYIFIKTIC